MWRLSWNLGASNAWNPQGLSGPVMGILFLPCVSIITMTTGGLQQSKLKCILVQALRLCTGRTAHTESTGVALLFLDHGTRRGWGVRFTPRPLLTPGKTRYSLYRRLGGPQGRSGQVRKTSPPSGFDTRTVQSVANRYTDWATRPTYSRQYGPKGFSF